MSTETAHPLLTFAHKSQKTVEVAFPPSRDDVQKNLIYAPTSQWKCATGIFNVMLGLLMDVRH